MTLDMCKELQSLDKKLVRDYKITYGIPVGIDWIDEDVSIGETAESFYKLLETESSGAAIQIFYILMLIYLSGTHETEYEKLRKYINLSWFEPLRPYVQARKLQNKVQAGERILAAKSISELIVEPLSASLIPEYLLVDNDAVLEHNGNLYAVEDVLLAITAAGGVAQALERQDLEGKNDKLGRLAKSSDEEADDGDEGEDAGDDGRKRNFKR